MRTEIIAKNNYKASEKLKDIIEKKVEKLSRYFGEDAKAKIVLKEVNKDKFAMEVTIHFDHGSFIRSEVMSDNMYDNIDLVLPKVERQIRKFKTKNEKKIKTDALGKLLYAEVGVMHEPVLARTKQLQLEVLHLDDAIESLQMVGHDFYLFINVDNDKVNAVYRRNDGDIGLLELQY